MKLIFKTDAWDIIINEEDYIASFNKSIQVLDRETGARKKMRKTSFEQYAELYEVPGQNKVIAFSFRKDCIDILDAKTLEILQSFPCKKRRGCKRNESILYYSKRKNSIYSAVELESDGVANPYITEISLESNTEKVITKMEDFYIRKFLEDSDTDDILVCGKKFYTFPGADGRGEYKGISLKNLDEKISFTEDVKKRMELCADMQDITSVKLDRAWKNWKQDIIYAMECGRGDYGSGADIYIFLADEIIGRTKAATVSENGKLLAYISADDQLFLYSLEDGKVLEKTNLRDEVKKGDFDFPEIKFLGDKYIVYGSYNSLYVYEVESE